MSVNMKLILTFRKGLKLEPTWLVTLTPFPIGSAER